MNFLFHSASASASDAYAAIPAASQGLLAELPARNSPCEDSAFMPLSLRYTCKQQIFRKLDPVSLCFSAQACSLWNCVATHDLLWRDRFPPLLVLKQLRETTEVLQEIAAQRYALTCNFDIFELALRRYYEEFRSCLPNSPPPSNLKKGDRDPRLNLITDIEAQAAWERTFGARQVWVDFEAFCSKLVEKNFPQIHASRDGGDRFRKHLRHAVNFPRDNIVTVYRWHVLMAVFGPFHDFVANFSRFVLGEGFLGLINMIKAEEILRDLLRNHFLSTNSVLIRFSRRRPEFLAFTSIDIVSGRVQHRRNIDNFGRPIPIASFLEFALPGYQLVKMGLNDVATQCENTFTFARHVSAYTTCYYT